MTCAWIGASSCLDRGAVDAEQPIAWFDGVFGPRTKTRYSVVAAPAVLLDRELGLGFWWTAEIAGLVRAFRTDHIDYLPRLAALLARSGQR